MSATMHRRPYVGEGVDGARRSAAIDRSEADGLDLVDPRRDEVLASAEAWDAQAVELEAEERTLVGTILEEAVTRRGRRRGLTVAQVTPLVGCLVTIARRDAANGAGGGIVHGRLVAIAQDGAYWQRPPSLVIVADTPTRLAGTNRIERRPRPERAGLVPIDLIVELGVVEGPA